MIKTCIVCIKGKMEPVDWLPKKGFNSTLRKFHCQKCGLDIYRPLIKRQRELFDEYIVVKAEKERKKA